MINDLHQQWVSLTSTFTEDDRLINSCWLEIKKHYTSNSRYYHDLSHTFHMLQLTDTIKSTIEDIDAFKFTIWYHDIIYKSTKKNNEEQSAQFAQKRLKLFNFGDNFIKTVEKLIISTKKHELLITKNLDNSYLLDIDLSILGSSWDVYEIYIKNIRKEYKIYPNFMYNPGRKQVLQHFLERKTLYFTNIFKNKYESQARKNLKREITLLN